MQTTEELYEQIKRVFRANVPEAIVKEGTFVMACNECGLVFPLSAEMGMVAEHFDIAHADITALEDFKATLDLIWVGEGPPPEPQDGA